MQAAIVHNIYQHTRRDKNSGTLKGSTEKIFSKIKTHIIGDIKNAIHADWYISQQTKNKENRIKNIHQFHETWCTHMTGEMKINIYFKEGQRRRKYDDADLEPEENFLENSNYSQLPLLDINLPLYRRRRRQAGDHHQEEEE